MPPVAGNIIWSRHLLKRIEEPMRKFESGDALAVQMGLDELRIREVLGLAAEPA